LTAPTFAALGNAADWGSFMNVFRSSFSCSISLFSRAVSFACWA
jgi:hypothetical protein